MQTTTMNLGNHETVTAEGVDAAFNAALLDSTPPTWSSADPTIVSISNVAANGLSAQINALKPTTGLLVTVQGTNSNHSVISSQFNAIVNEVPAGGFAFTFGAPA